MSKFSGYRQTDRPTDKPSPRSYDPELKDSWLTNTTLFLFQIENYEYFHQKDKLLNYQGQIATFSKFHDKLDLLDNFIDNKNVTLDKYCSFILRFDKIFAFLEQPLTTPWNQRRNLGLYQTFSLCMSICSFFHPKFPILVNNF